MTNALPQSIDKWPPKKRKSVGLSASGNGSERPIYDERFAEAVSGVIVSGSWDFIPGRKLK